MLGSKWHTDNWNKRKPLDFLFLERFSWTKMHTNGCWLSFGKSLTAKEIRVIAQSNQAWAPAGCSLIRTSWTMLGLPVLPHQQVESHLCLCGSGPVRPGSGIHWHPGCWHLCGQCRVTVQGMAGRLCPGSGSPSAGSQMGLMFFGAEPISVIV